MRFYAIVCFFIISFSTFGQKAAILDKPKVDERVELLSIVFRLAGNREYNSKIFSKYVDGIENHFGKHENHKLIKYIKKKLRKRGIGFDAVMCMAISISEDYPFEPLVPFSTEIPEERWGKKRGTKFLSLLNEFYKDTDCTSFFKKNKELYAESSKRFKSVFDELDINWYQDFYGQEPKGEFKIVNGLGNGGGNYGPKISINGKEIIYAIMGTWSVDSLGMPHYKLNSYFPTLLHEFNHSFVNHVVEKHHEELRNSGKTIFKPLEKKMASQAYMTWETMYAEAVVRAAVIKYLKDHDYDDGFVQMETIGEIDRGFLWTPELVSLLEEYDGNRKEYPSLEDFMPRIVLFFNQVASDFAGIQKRIESKRPSVVKLIPFENGSEGVDAAIEKITIVFDRPLKGKGYSINYGEKGKSAFPGITEINYSEDKRQRIEHMCV